MAQPNAVGWKGVPEGIRIGCDELSQVKAIVEAGRTSLEAWGLKFKEFHDQTDSLGEPSCMVGPIEAEVTYTYEEDLGTVTWGNKVEHIWAVEAVVGKTDFFIIYEEVEGSEI
jgi:hypothetical protein